MKAFSSRLPAQEKRAKAAPRQTKRNKRNNPLDSTNRTARATPAESPARALPRMRATTAGFLFRATFSLLDSPGGARGDEDFFQAQRFTAQLRRMTRAQSFQDVIAIAIGENFHVEAGAPDVQRAGKIEIGRRLRKGDANFLKAV